MATYINMSEGLIPVPQPTFHFYLNNIFEWRTGDDLHTLMKEMDKQKQTYWVWYVPGDAKSKYDIKWYAPQVEGAFVLTRVEYSKGKRIVK